MEALDALVFALIAYALTIVVALFVGVVIVVIRRLTADRVEQAPSEVKKDQEPKEATA